MKCGKVIGVGFTATVYEWDENRVLKLFNQGFPIEAIKNEYHNAMAIREMNFAKPKAYEMVTYEGKTGIIYDKVEGESLLDWVLRTYDLQECATCMAKIHKTILQNKISGVPNYKDFVKYHISIAEVPSETKQAALHKVDQLSDGDTLCHGDFHPGNILISGDKAYVIDFMNICHGDYLYDIARTVYLIQYTPVPPEANDKEQILLFKKTLADLYLAQMNVTREMIQDYLSVIMVARKGENPNE